MKDKPVRAFYESRDQSSNRLWGGYGENFSFPAHLHEELELFQTCRGRNRVTVGTAQQTLCEGDIALIFPNTIHAYECESEGSRELTMIFPVGLWGEYMPRLLHYAPVSPFLRREAVHPDVPYVLQRLLEQAQTRPEPELLRALTHLLLARLLDGLPLMPVKEMRSTDLTVRLVRYLSQNFLRPLSLETVARDLGVSRYHLSHVCSYRLGTGFPDYLNCLRLNHACQLLQTTDLPISDIALESGFTSQRTFNRAFLKQFACSPRQYRSGPQG